MPNDNTIQSLWVGECLTRVEILSIQSFLANGHDYHLYIYSNVDGIPAGVTVKDANAIIPDQYVFRTKGSLSIFADWFRQELLFARGGYWADLDIVCLKPLQFDDEIVVGKEDSSRVSNAVMRFPKGHEITRALADVSREPNLAMPYDSDRDRRRKFFRRYVLGNRRNRIQWGEPSGPIGLTKMLKYQRLLKLVKPYYYFHPLHFSIWRCAWDDTFRDGLGFFRSSYCVHLWNEKIRRTGFDKNVPFPPNSLVHQLASLYGV